MYKNMKLIVIFMTLVVGLPFISAFNQEKEAFIALMKLLELPQIPERYVSPMDAELLPFEQPMVTSFSWKSCGPNDPITAEVVLSPDPLVIPGNVTVEAKATLKVDVVSPVKVSLSIKKKVLVWIPIPCIDNVGSCTYDDICEMLNTTFPPSQPCPEPFASSGLPCHCPFSAGDYNLPATQVEVDDTGIPSWLSSGDYQVKAVAQDSSGKELACFTATLTLK
ncbi:ganglioside GM2 activator-like [Lytechinus pictus]|uniref:ganglioside GM2 activator-like n=1 Tax=Lytechinus pictus TaxID=7653 RepID=UPI0030B9DA4D